MQKIFAIMFVVFATFIFVLCAMEPIIARPLAAEINDMDTLVLSTEPQAYTSAKDQGKVYLYLNSTKPLTVRYLAENPDYYLTFNALPQGLYIYLGNESTQIVDFSSDEAPVRIDYSVFQTMYESDPTNARWDAPIVVSGLKAIMPTQFSVAASAVYKEEILKGLTDFFPTFWDGVKTVINFVVSNPIVLLCTGVLLVGSALALVKRLRY